MRARRSVFLTVLIVVLLLLHGIPWWRLVLAPHWPVAVTVVGSAVALVALLCFPLAMWKGHGKSHRDRLAIVGDVWLGIVWQLFAWTILGEILDLVLALSGVHAPGRQRWVAVTVVVWVVLLCSWGTWQARRIPPVKTVEITLPRLGSGLDGLRVVLIADTHFGPINRARWSAGLVDRANALDPDVFAHAGDLTDGSVDQRGVQVAPLGGARASLARVYITGNHEYMSGAPDWVAHMDGLGWTVLHNRNIVLERGGSKLVVAGIDDLSAKGSGVPGHAADLPTALAGVDPQLPIMLLAHQPKSVRTSASAGVDLQLSGHTHGGQMWPFHHLVRAEQGALAGLSRHGERTVLYTSRGSGFWGPPFRIFAPNEITLLILRSDPNLDREGV
jgi:predicted MPP superfamily phosphohydrolase